MPNPFDEPPAADDWEEQRRRVIGLGENSFRKSYYPELRRNVTNVKNLLLAVEQSPRGLFICLRNGRVDYANGTLCALTGLTPEAVLGEPAELLWRHVRQGDDYACIRQQLAGGGTWQGDLLIVKGTDEPRWVQASMTPIHDEAGELTHFLGGMEDISARKRVEEELVAMSLARSKALEAAERLSALKSEFIANMSHELRTPLAHIMGLAQVSTRARDLDKARENAGKIAEAGKRLFDLVSAVLDFSAVAEGKLTLRREPFDPAPMLEEVAARAQERAAAKGLAFEFHAPGGALPLLIGDRARLQQVLDELLGNAVKFTLQGKISLSVRTAGDELEFAVADSGIGLAAEQFDYAIKPFQQVDGSSTRRFGGVGLGLALIHHLIVLMDGRLQLYSEPGRGSEFRLSLPLAP